MEISKKIQTNIGIINKCCIFAGAVPVIPLPVFMLVTNPGFFCLYTMTEFEFLQNIFSAQRMSKYVSYYHGDEEKAVLHYKYNIRLSESLYTSLSVFEVTLRNALSNELKKMTGRDDWYNTFQDNPSLKNLSTEVSQAIHHITERGEHVCPDKIVSELTFGFWVSLLNSQYEMILWKSLRKAFPYMPKNLRKRKNVSSPCNAFRKLRNRIFHHEAICWSLNYVIQLHQMLYTMLGWMNKDMPDWLSQVDNFDSTICYIRSEMGKH